MKPLPHQEKFVKGYKGKRIIAWEGGVGKTIAGCLWIKDGKDEDAYVICPKRVAKKWEKALTDWGTKATVLTKNEFKNHIFTKKPTAIVYDEADEFASPLFTPQRSGLTEKAYNLYKEWKPETLLLTATPVRSTPWNLHTLLCLSGTYIDWKKWRSAFFVLTKRPYMARMGWVPKTGWQKKLRPLLEKACDIVLLSDCVGVLPPLYEEKVTITSPEFKAERWDYSFADEHRHEQINKPSKIIEIGKEYRKVIVVAHYVEQVQELKKQLSKDRQTFAIWGKVKDQEKIIEQAQESEECFFIVQASLGAGFDGNQFSAVIFASMSYAVRDFVQMKFRVRRIHDLHPVAMYYLIGGRCDQAVLKNIELGKDFVPSEWKK
jgi:hypothetical protein